MKELFQRKQKRWNLRYSLLPYVVVSTITGYITSPYYVVTQVLQYEMLFLSTTFPKSSVCIVWFNMGCQNNGWDSGHSKVHQNTACQYS